MAKTKGPLFSLGAHGSLGKELNYSRRRSGDQCRQYNKPTGVPSAKQRAQRRLTEFLVAQWQNMSAADKATWAANARGTGLNLSGYHYFLRSAQKDLYTHHGLCGYWHCNEIVGGQVLDLSGNGNHGTLEPTYPSNAPILANSYNTRFSKALLYDGVDERVDCGNGAVLDITGALTLIVWFNTNDITTRQEILSKHEFQVGGYLLRLENQELILIYDASGAQHVVNTINAPISDTGKWYQFIGVLDGADGYIYLNGKQARKEAEGTPDSTVYKVFIGGGGVDGGVSTFNGLIDEVCIYKRAFSAAEITTRYKFTTQKVS